MTPAERRRLNRLNALSRAERAAILRPQTLEDVFGVLAGELRDEHPDAKIETSSTGMDVALPGGTEFHLSVVDDPDGLPHSVEFRRGSR